MVEISFGGSRAKPSGGMDDTAINKQKKPPKPLIKKAVSIYPCTVALLYTKLKPEMELLTDNCATEVTSWDYFNSPTRGTPGTPSEETAFGFRQRCDDFGDYVTGADAVTNKIKESRKPKPKPPGGGETGSGDSNAWPSGDEKAVIAWYHITAEDESSNGLWPGADGKRFKAENVSTHPDSIAPESGPGECMEVWRGSKGVGIFPDLVFGQEPFSAYLKKTAFPELGGYIGYTGGINIWHGVQDLAGTGIVYSRPYPMNGWPAQIPISFPSEFSGEPWEPWFYTDGSFYSFGWDLYPLNIFSSGFVSVELSALLNPELGCNVILEQEDWYFSGNSPYGGGVFGGGQFGNSSGLGGTGMFVCWKGHADHLSMFKSFLEAAKDYWKIGDPYNILANPKVTFLGAVNPYGCVVGDPTGGGGGGGGGGFPPAPPVTEPRILLDTYGRKAEVWLKVCRQEDPPLEIKLPFEYIALVEQIRCPSDWEMYSQGNFKDRYATAELMGGFGTNYNTFGCDMIHATVNIDEKGEFAYVDILYGAERVFQQPFTTVIPSRLSNVGKGPGHDSYGFASRNAGTKHNGFVEGEWVAPNTVEEIARVRGDYFSFCQSYKIQLPTKSSKTLAIVASEKYKRPEPITLSAGTPDNEFNNKYLICDFRTERVDNIPSPEGGSAKAPWQNPQPYFATFGGLPCLFQVDKYNYYRHEQWVITQGEPYYKAPEDWTDLDHIYFELMERPEIIWGESDLPTNVFIAQIGSGSQGTIKFNLDGKFQRQGRCEVILHADYFGLRWGDIEQYDNVTNFPLSVEFKEQMIGNGIIKGGVLTKWFRIATSSFPVFDQSIREQ